MTKKKTYPCPDPCYKCNTYNNYVRKCLDCTIKHTGDSKYVPESECEVYKQKLAACAECKHHIMRL